MRHRIVLVTWIAAIVVCAALTAPQAKAGDYGPGRPFGPDEEIAFAQAEAFWEQQPTLCTSLTREVVPVGALDGPDGGASGRATQPLDNKPTYCGVWIIEGMNQWSLCTVMRHEYGHLLGYGHEDLELAQMPGCSHEAEAGATGGVYVPPSAKQVKRHQDWELFREWRTGCWREPIDSKARRRCFGAVKRYAARLRSIWG